MMMIMREGTAGMMMIMREGKAGVRMMRRGREGGGDTSGGVRRENDRFGLFIVFKTYSSAMPTPKQEREFGAQRGPEEATGVHRPRGLPHVHRPVADQPQRRGQQGTLEPTPRR